MGSSGGGGAAAGAAGFSKSGVRDARNGLLGAWKLLVDQLITVVCK